MDSCPNCQQRMRFNAMYQKYLKDTGDRADVKWIAKMVKLDKKILFCLNQTKEKYWAENGWYEDGAEVHDAVMGEI